MSGPDNRKPRVVLASRKNGGVRVTLFWAVDTNTVAVRVRDEIANEQFDCSSSPKPTQSTSTSTRTRTPPGEASTTGPWSAPSQSITYGDARKARQAVAPPGRFQESPLGPHPREP
jgi:hypothetical protein